MSPPTSDADAASDGYAGAIPPIDTLPRIGGGLSADVFALPDGRVLKLLRAGIDRGLAEREQAAMRLADAAGVPVTRPIALVTVDGRPGLIVERLSGTTALALLARAPHRVFAVLRDLAAYQARLHAVRADDGALPSMHVVLDARASWSTAAPHVAAAARARLAALPHGDRLCHGDLHPDNIMLTTRGPIAIDWSQATRGDPAADVARTELLLRYASYGRHLRRYPPLRAIRHLTAWWYRRCYRRASGMPDAAVAAWRLPVAVGWMQPGGAGFAPSLQRITARWA